MRSDVGWQAHRTASSEGSSNGMQLVATSAVSESVSRNTGERCRGCRRVVVGVPVCSEGRLSRTGGGNFGCLRSF